MANTDPPNPVSWHPPLNLCGFPRKTRWHRFAPGEWVGLLSGIPLPLSQAILCRGATWGLAPQPSPSSTRPSWARGDLLKASSVLGNRSVCSLARHGPAKARLLPTGATQLTPRVAVISRRYSSPRRACASFPAARGSTGTLVLGTQPHIFAGRPQNPFVDGTGHTPLVALN